MASLDVKGDTMTKLGSILAAGIMDAGGRNASLSLLSPTGHKKMAAIVGMAIFPQFWYWFPLVHFISLAFSVTAVIGLDKDLKMPKNFTLHSDAAPSAFAYPEKMKVEAKEEKKEMVKATLSVSAKASKKKAEKDKLNASMDTTTDEAGAAAAAAAAMNTSTDDATGKTEDASSKPDAETDKETGKEAEAEEEEAEPAFEELQNPARVVAQQLAVLRARPQRYVPIKPRISSGFLLLKDTRPTEPTEYVTIKSPKITQPGIDPDEPEPPMDFQFTRR